MQKIEKRESVVLENHGQKIFGILHTPLQRQVECPAVLFCHGLAGHKTGKYRLYVILAERLSQLGIASLRIDFRGSGDSEGQFDQMTPESEVSDALKGLDYLRQHSAIAGHRIGIFGRSFGGTVGVMTANRASICCLATWAPLFDAEQWKDKWKALHLPEVDEEQRQAMMRVNGQVPGKEFFQQLFAMDMKALLKPLEHLPFLDIHGEQDEMVDIQHSFRFEDVRQSASGKSCFIRLPHSDHDFTHPKDQQEAIDHTCSWFSNTL